MIVTQKYHRYPAMYIAERFDMKSYGVSSDYNTYYGQFYRDVREVPARVKDFTASIRKPKPTFLGDPVDIHGSGDVTND